MQITVFKKVLSTKLKSNRNNFVTTFRRSKHDQVLRKCIKIYQISYLFDMIIFIDGLKTAATV